MPNPNLIVSEDTSRDHPPSLTAEGMIGDHLSDLGWAAPWLHQRKSEAWERYQRLPVPRRSDESWRFATVRDLDLTAYHLPQGMGSRPSGAGTDTVPIESIAGLLEFQDDETLRHVAPPEDLRARGVIFCSMEEALREHGPLVREHLLSRLPDIGSKKYEALHEALFHNGTFLYVPADVEIKAPFLVRHWTGDIDGTALFPHTLVVTERHAVVTLFEIFQARSADTAHFVGGVGDIYAGEGAKVHYHAIQDWNRNTLAFHLNSASAERDALLKSVTVHVGSRHTRNEQHCRILGQGASVDLDSLVVATGKQEIDQRTLQTHAAPDGHSDLLFKNVLCDEARTIFSGLIRVEEEAQRTDAYQTNRNLLLNENAEANSLPGLEIGANDVKCSHGATTGKIDDTNLFYFLSRGISREVAEELLVFGFFEEIVEKIDHEEVRDLIRDIVRKRFREQYTAAK